MPNPNKMLYKIQRPITTNGKPMALVYNQSRKDMFEMPLTRRLLAFMGDDYKVYVYGRREAGRFDYITEKQPNPGW